MSSSEAPPPPRKQVAAKRRRESTSDSDLADAKPASTGKKEILSSSDGLNVMTEPTMVVVGEEKEEFFVHTHLLIASSKYLEKLLSINHGRYYENGKRVLGTVKLSEEDPTAFRMFAQLLYTARFHIPSIPSPQDARTLKSSSAWKDITSCYKLAVALEASGFANATIDAYIQCMSIIDGSSEGMAKFIFPQTTRDSAHRLLCRDIVVHTWDRSSLNILSQKDFPREFVDSVLEAVSSNLESVIKRQGVTEFLALRDSCAYHEHVRLGVPCYKATFGL